jgi:hypothetical protein
VIVVLSLGEIVNVGVVIVGKNTPIAEVNVEMKMILTPQWL